MNIEDHTKHCVYIGKSNQIVGEEVEVTKLIKESLNSL